MNQSIKILLAALFAVSSTVFAEVSDINKTFIALRDQRNRAAHMTTFATLAAPKNDDRLGGAFQVTGFYNGGTKSVELGQALMKNGKNFIVIDNAGAGDNENGRFTVHADNAVAPNTNLASVTADKVAITPEVNSYGVLLKYNQQLDGLAEGLWFAVNAPIANVQTNANLAITNPSAAFGGLTLNQYLAGTAGTFQEGLKYSKIDGKAHDRTELGDVEVQLGWNFVDSEKHQVGINMGVHFPTGTKPTGEFLFEPTVGSVHWAIGAGLNVNATMWENDTQALKFLATADYRYLLEDTERRTLELVQNGVPVLGRWANIASFNTTAPLRPAANDLTRDFNITPGSQVDTIAAFEYTNGGFSFDVGYNLFFKDAETGSLKQAWVDNQIGIAQSDIITTALALAHGAAGTVQRLLSINNVEEAAAGNILAGFRIDQNAVLAPSALTHKVFAGMGYTATEWDYPVMVGVGGSYEFVNNARTAAEGFGVWGKVGVAF